MAFNWIRRIIYIGDVGRLDAGRNYPGEADFIEIPLYGVAREAAEAVAPAAGSDPKDATPAAPANDPLNAPHEIGA